METRVFIIKSECCWYGDAQHDIEYLTYDIKKAKQKLKEIIDKELNRKGILNGIIVKQSDLIYELVNPKHNDTLEYSDTTFLLESKSNDLFFNMWIEEYKID